MINEQPVDRVGRLLTVAYCEEYFYYAWLLYPVESDVGRLCRIRHQIIQQGCFITIVLADKSLGIAQLQVGPNGLKAQMASWVECPSR